MGKYHITINNKNDENTIITKIEHIIEDLNHIYDESDNIEKDLEERYKDEIDNLKTFCHDINLREKCFTSRKSKNINVI
jgi:uncharacterized membrane protein